MTTILAVENEDGCIFAADRQTTDDARPYYNKEVQKISLVGEYIIAGAGVASYCDIIQYGWVPPKYDGTDMYRFMVNVFVPEVRKMHASTNYTMKEDDSFAILVGLNGNIFYIAEDYSVLRSHNGIYGVGTGCAYAIGAYESGATPEQALKIAIKYDINSGGGVQVVKGKRNA